MDFFARQDQVRRHGFRLLLVFALAVLMTVVAIDLVVGGLFHWWHGWNASRPASMGVSGFVRTSVIALLVIGGGAAWRMYRLRGSGASMLEAMGAILVPEDTRQPDLRILRNVIEEIAIASSVPVPDIFVMEDEPCINAFTVGHTAADAAICVTGGCLDLLDREELQGLVAHQFSHILHGEMALNIRMTGLLFGIHGVSVLGKRVLLAGLPGLVVGLPMIVAGGVGSVFARLVQAAVVRSQVALADAAAVQFTRQASGIAGALKKIVAFQHGSMLMVGNRDEVAHMAFGDPARSWWLRIHPPIPTRVRALGQGWSDMEIRRMHDNWREWKSVSQGRLRSGRAWKTTLRDDGARASVSTASGPESNPSSLSCTVTEKIVALPPSTEPAEPVLAGAAGVARSLASDTEHERANLVLRAVENPAPAPVAAASRADATEPDGDAAQPGVAHIGQAAQVRDQIPSYLRHAVQNPVLAAGVILALVLDSKEALRKRQVAHVEQTLGPQLAMSADNMQHMLKRMSPMQRLPLANLAFPCLRRNPSLDIRKLMAVLSQLVRMDQCVNVHEFCLQHMLNAQFNQLLRPARRRPAARKRLVQCRGTVAMLCAMVAHQAGNRAEAQQAFRRALAHVFPGWEHDFSVPRDWQGALDGVLTGLAGLTGDDQRRLVDGLALAVQADGVVRVEEAELLRVICADLGSPLPLSIAEPQDPA